MKKLIFLSLLFGYLASCQTKVQPKPIADFDFAAVTGTTGQIQFTNKSTNADRYQWTFSDGQALTEESPIVTFKDNGIYTVTLTAKSSAGADNIIKSVEITGVSTPSPIANFDMTLVSGTVGQVQFTNKSTNAERYQWIFGDGQASTETNPLITFKNNGSYSAKLTAKNKMGIDEVTKTVQINGITTTGTVLFWTNSGASLDIEIYIDSALKGLITQSQSTAPACGADGYVTLTYPAGIYTYYAKSKNKNWSGSITIKNGECTSKLLTP